jgi:hypothetical protein
MSKKESMTGDANAAASNSAQNPKNRGIFKRFVWQLLKPCLYVLFLGATVVGIFLSAKGAVSPLGGDESPDMWS